MIVGVMGTVLLFMNSLRLIIRFHALHYFCSLSPYLTLYSLPFLLKDLPVYMLFESSCGYALLRARDMFIVERNYIAIEKYINRCDEFFELIAYQPYKSADDALVHLNAICTGMFINEFI